MTTINPLIFNKNEIALSTEIIEWKKQIATNSKKKDLSAIEYLNQKYSIKLTNAVVFAYFDYVEDTTIYLMYFADSNKTTEINFDSHIPSINMVEIVDEFKDIESLEDKIIIKGQVYGFCLSNETYYFNSDDNSNNWTTNFSDADRYIKKEFAMANAILFF